MGKWEDTQALNFLPKFICATLKMTLKKLKKKKKINAQER